MYNIASLVGKVITIKSHKNDEFVATLLGVNEEKTVLTVSDPKIVAIANDTVVLIPFALTAKAEEVHLHINQIFAVLETAPETAKEYGLLIEEEKRLAPSEIVVDDAEEIE